MTPILLSLFFGAPWLAAIAILWPRARKADVLPPSLGQTAAERLRQV